MDFINYIFASIVFLTSFIPKIFIVQSGSMEPNIKTGSLVFVTKPDKYLIDDIITFKNNSGVAVTHRIKQKGLNPNEFITKGDANKVLDSEVVKSDQIIGKVNLTIPYLGYIGNFAKTPKGFIVLIIIPATIIIYEELKFLKKEAAKLIKKKGQVEPPLSEQNNSPKKSILLPIIGSLIVLTSSITISFFLDNEKSIGNTLGAASTYGEKTALLYVSNEYECALGATNLGTQQAKLAIIKKVDNNINAVIKLENATPNSIYEIWLNQHPGACPLATPTKLAGITTDALGNGIGNAQAEVVIGATKFWVSAVGGGQVLRSTAVEL